MSINIILGASNDCHALHMLRACHRHGLDAELFDTSAYPALHSISWDPESQEGHLRLDSKRYRFVDINSVFWSSVNQPTLVHTANLPINQIAISDSCSALRTFFDEERIYWLNSWQVFDSHKVKPRQLQKAAQAGAQIPRTYVGNDQQALLDFAKQSEQLIVKPVYGGAHACLMSNDMIQPERLKRVLKQSPITIQQYIKGTNVRTFVIGKNVYSALIISPKSDFRLDPDPQHIPVQTPDKLAKLAIKICYQLGMEWTAIDWRKDESGNYFFLEANPSPMFIHFENVTGYPITQELIRLLQQPHRMEPAEKAVPF